MNKELIFRGGCDLCYTQSELISIANAIAMRYDAGICRHKNEHPGVIEIWRITNEDREIDGIK